jgi:hypothetical protein
MPEFCQLAEKYHSNDASGDTEMKDAAQPARMPLMIVNNDNPGNNWQLLPTLANIANGQKNLL